MNYVEWKKQVTKSWPPCDYFYNTQKDGYIYTRFRNMYRHNITSFKARVINT
jgi:hypothetical protein